MREETDQFSEWDLTAHIPEGGVPLGFCAVLKYLNEEGNVALATATSAEIPDWERLGMHRTAVLDAEQSINASLVYLEQDDD